MPPDEITTGELGRRMDAMHSDLQQILLLIGSLDTKFVPRAELDERQKLADIQHRGLEQEVRTIGDDLATYKADVAAARRWAIGTAVVFVVGFASLLATIFIH